jgi:hypothetical protein
MTINRIEPTAKNVLLKAYRDNVFKKTVFKILRDWCYGDKHSIVPKSYRSAMNRTYQHYRKYRGGVILLDGVVIGSTIKAEHSYIVDALKEVGVSEEEIKEYENIYREEATEWYNDVAKNKEEDEIIKNIFVEAYVHLNSNYYAEGQEIRLEKIRRGERY